MDWLSGDDEQSDLPDRDDVRARSGDIAGAAVESQPPRGNCSGIIGRANGKKRLTEGYRPGPGLDRGNSVPPATPRERRSWTNRPQIRLVQMHVVG